jgi:hypothetical protein
MKVEVLNIKGLTRQLQQYKRAEGDAKPSVIAGYTAAYGIYVHEMAPADPHWGRPRTGHHDDGSPKKGEYWDPTGLGQPKFLEKPARDLLNDGSLSRLITKIVKKGGSVKGGLIAAGVRIMSESQRLVPVDTGTLKASAIVISEDDNVEHWKG